MDGEEVVVDESSGSGLTGLLTSGNAVGDTSGVL